MEKPKFMNKLAENVTEPRYAEIDKSEDVKKYFLFIYI